jgi:hypothetical protein
LGVDRYGIFTYLVGAVVVGGDVGAAVAFLEDYDIGG